MHRCANTAFHTCPFFSSNRALVYLQGRNQQTSEVPHCTSSITNYAVLLQVLR